MFKSTMYNSELIINYDSELRVIHRAYYGRVAR